MRRRARRSQAGPIRSEASNQRHTAIATHGIATPPGARKLVGGRGSPATQNQHRDTRRHVLRDPRDDGDHGEGLDSLGASESNHGDTSEQNRDHGNTPTGHRTEDRRQQTFVAERVQSPRGDERHERVDSDDGDDDARLDDQGAGRAENLDGSVPTGLSECASPARVPVQTVQTPT